MNGTDKLYIRSTQSRGKSCGTVVALSDLKKYAEEHRLKIWVENGRVVTECRSYPFHQTVYIPLTVRG